MFTVGAEMEQRLLYIYSCLFGRLFSHPTSTMPHVWANEKKTRSECRGPEQQEHQEQIMENFTYKLWAPGGIREWHSCGCLSEAGARSRSGCDAGNPNGFCFNKKMFYEQMQIIDSNEFCWVEVKEKVQSSFLKTLKLKRSKFLSFFLLNFECF